ncbi:hypothetical protein BC826DRAFT_1016848 [Russula brevipes]|nr:hypothetical protein BC826DRAFT_1016848 [Russula brevipes]
MHLPLSSVPSVMWRRRTLTIPAVRPVWSCPSRNLLSRGFWASPILAMASRGAALRPVPNGQPFPILCQLFPGRPTLPASPARRSDLATDIISPTRLSWIDCPSTVLVPGYGTGVRHVPCSLCGADLMCGSGGHPRGVVHICSSREKAPTI